MTMDVAERNERPAEEQIATTVVGRGGHAAVAATVTDPLPHIAELLAATFPDRPLWTLELLRSKYKPPRKLTGYYVATGPHGQARRHLAVSWLGDGRVAVLAAPDDPVMPHLDALSDPGRLGALIAGLTGRTPRPADPDVETVRYRPGQRHVLVARYVDAPTVHVKTDRDGSGAWAVPVARLLDEVLARSSVGAAPGSPVGYLPAVRTALWWHVAGRPVGPLLEAGASAAPVAERVGRAARAIHDVAAVTGPDPATDGLPRRDVRSEASAALRAGEHIIVLLPDVGSAYTAMVAAVADGLDRLPAEAPSLVHGDLKADNLLLEGDRLRLLDLDRACWAEPALDLGKFLADLRWWSSSGAAAAALEVAFRAGYGACDPLRWARAELLAILMELKLAARRCPVHHARWPVMVEDRIMRAARRSAVLAGGL
jgi:hypothetical protein